VGADYPPEPKVGRGSAKTPSDFPFAAAFILLVFEADLPAAPFPALYACLWLQFEGWRRRGAPPRFSAAGREQAEPESAGSVTLHFL